MTRRTRAALWLALGALLLGHVGPAQAQIPIFNSTDPNQLSVAAALFVKVDAKSNTDTILVVNRQQAGDSTTTGSAIAIHLRFYGAGCDLKFDNNVSLTPQGIFTGLVSQVFGVDAPGVVLADSFAAGSATAQFALSGVVIDGNFGALYERQGSPLLNTVFADFSWGGFSRESIDDWFIGGFTMLQMMCPLVDDEDPDDLGTLAGDMHELSGDDDFPNFFFATGFPVVNVYDAKEVLKRSIHDVPCFCNTDSAFFGPDSRGKGYPGDFVDIIASMKTVGLGTFHWDDPTNVLVGEDGKFMAWRVISAAPGSPIHWDARLRTTSDLTP